MTNCLSKTEIPYGKAPATFRRKELLVGPSTAGSRLDLFLAAQKILPSRSSCAHLIEDAAVCINGTLATSKSEKVVLGDRVSVEIPLPRSDPNGLVPNFSIPLDIRFEDEWLVVLSKQTGLVCHPSPGHVNDTLANALVARFGYDHLGHLQGDDRPGIVHRLDRDTSGLMVAAKDDATQRALQDLIRLRTLDRRYLTLVWGYVAPDEGTITTGIARSRHDRLKMAVSEDPGAREAITTFRVLERFEAGRRDEGYSLLECHLYTGRTHQIRVHMRYAGHPVIGDPLYGRGDDRTNLGLKRQFLHSWHIAFDHPVTGEAIVEADPLPVDLIDILKKLGTRSMGRTAAGDVICPHALGV
jgi:23S rRNA pseudouridine1911/1915/1917 synthase